MCSINDILRQAIRRAVTNHLAHLFSVELPGPGLTLCIIIDIAHQTPDPEVAITLVRSLGSAGAVEETLQINTTIGHNHVVDWPAWAAKAAPIIATLTTTNLATLFQSDNTINNLSIFINSELELSIIKQLLFYLSGFFSKMDRILKTVFHTTSAIDRDTIEFTRLYENWNAISTLDT
jgi:uncharacterized membrane protein